MSSATAMTSPALAPTSPRVMSESAATLRPTCFIAVSARRPVIDAPSATSSATFSFVDHSAYTPSRPASVARISVEGVPGYAAATSSPASQAPRARASLPDRKSISGSAWAARRTPARGRRAPR